MFDSGVGPLIFTSYIRTYVLLFPHAILVREKHEREKIEARVSLHDGTGTCRDI